VNQFRKYARYIVLSVLFGMLIISFALWGIGDMLRLGGRSTEVAHVGGTHIPLYGWLGGTSVSVEEVRERFNRQLEQIQRQTGQRPEPEQALRFGLHIRALEDVIQRAVIDNAIKQYGLVISDDEVRAAIARTPPSRAPVARSIPCAFATCSRMRASAKRSTSPTSAARSRRCSSSA
jgi:peptidyl-prolyl cis-trans isomerase D